MIAIFYSAYSLPFLYASSLSKSPIRTCSAVIGSVRKRSPVALYTASAIAGAGVLITISPIDFAPNGPVVRSCSQTQHGLFRHRDASGSYTASGNC